MSENPSRLFKELWGKYQSKIYRYFLREFDKSTAEDLCQQTYLNAWKYIDSLAYKNILQQRAWIYSVAKNVRNDHLRYMSSHKQNFIWQELLDSDRSYEPNLEESLLIQKAFSELCQEDKELLNMSEYLTSKEIGEILGISDSAVRSRKQKAKERLSEKLRKYGIEL